MKNKNENDVDNYIFKNLHQTILAKSTGVFIEF